MYLNKLDDCQCLFNCAAYDYFMAEKIVSMYCWQWWWWSSGQRARLLLRRSEFESRLSIQFLVCKLFEKDANNQKEAGNGPFLKRQRNGIGQCHKEVTEWDQKMR